jgi:hypothetical protein
MQLSQKVTNAHHEILMKAAPFCYRKYHKEMRHERSRCAWKPIGDDRTGSLLHAGLALWNDMPDPQGTTRRSCLHSCGHPTDAWWLFLLPNFVQPWAMRYATLSEFMYLGPFRDGD